MRGADQLVKTFRATIAPGTFIPADKTWPDFPQMDQFYYAWGKDKDTTQVSTFIQKFERVAKLNDKALATIKDTGIKSELLGMATPTCVDLGLVKQECKEIDELQTVLKTLQSDIQVS